MTYEIQDVTVSPRFDGEQLSAITIRLDSWDDNNDTIEPDVDLIDYPIVDGVIPTTVDIIEEISKHTSQNMVEYEMYILTQLLTIEKRVEMINNPFIDVADPIVHSISKCNNTICIRFDVDLIPVILYDSVYEFVYYDIRDIRPKFHDKQSFELTLQNKIREFVNFATSLNF